MRIFVIRKITGLIIGCLSCLAINAYADSKVNQSQINSIVDHVIQPLMQKYQIPGMAVAITIDGKNYFYNYGVLSKETHQPVTNHTLFEIGSVTKTFTATLASYAEEDNKLSLLTATSHYLPQLRSSVFDKISVLNLGTHTAGTPLFLPDQINSANQFMAYLKNWKPAYAVGTRRVYSNVGIDLLGMSAAASLHGDYNILLNKIILIPLKLKHTYLEVPANQLPNYAEGYTANNTMHRIPNIVTFPEAYGLRSCSADLIRYVQANLSEISIPAKLQRAILNTHIAYFKTKDLTQDLVWEQYAYPVTLKQLLIGNSPAYIYQPAPVTKITLPQPPQTQVLINKTGSTDGFSSYVAFIPAKKAGVVILANKSFPLEQRVTAGYQILSQLTYSEH